MVNRKDKLFEDIGEQVKNVRRELKLTMDEVSKETGISRSYISDFERGYRLPTSKYLRYLHDRHEVNLNHIFLGESNMLRPGTKNTLPYFTNIQGAIENLLCFMYGNPHACYSILAYAEKYKIKNIE